MICQQRQENDEKRNERKERRGEEENTIKMVLTDGEEVRDVSGDVSQGCSNRQGEDRSSGSLSGRAFS